MLFHMLRAQMGDVPFKSPSRLLPFQIRGENRAVEDFENIAERHARPP